MMKGGTGLKEWSAPETRQRLYYGMEIDAWAVGCILYYMLSGNEPFEPSSNIQAQHQILFDDLAKHTVFKDQISL
jgi:serine/threonine protein kinase